MDRFQEKFIVEATDHINDLEDALLSLENNPDDNELIERVFRAMHSLKGGSAMFGFDKIDEFTHHLETVYDFVRSGKLNITEELLNVTLASVDHLKMLLKDQDLSDEQDIIIHEKLTKNIISIINEIENDKIIESDEQSNDDISNSDNLITYYILFQPYEDILADGTNPLYLIDELRSLGECKVIPHTRNIPDLEALDTSLCYVFWEIILATKEDIKAIQDIFIFVEDNCELVINKIAEENLLINKKFLDKIEESIKARKEIDFTELQSFVKITGKKTQKEKVTSLKTDLPEDKKSAISSIRVSSDKLDELMNLVSEMVTNQARLSLFAEQSKMPELNNIAEDIQKLTRQLRDNAFEICLIPIQNMITSFQRLVRDISNELKKDIKFVTEGTETELDKTIIESLTDPLLHILRNCIDHGIEHEDERIKLGKPKQGKILLKAFSSGANVHIQIHDDGAGIDPEKIREKAISKGIISPEDKLSKKEIYDLLFLAGFSTAKKVTNLSGRGVGLDVVKRKIAGIRGEVEINSEINAGTTISIILPLTLSIIDGLLVRIDNTDLIIPLSAVDKIYPAKTSELVNAFNPVVVLDGKQIPFIYLRKQFNITENCPNNIQIVVVNFENTQIGLTVDHIVGEYQAVLKPLGKIYKDQDFISGTSILGDGTVALVMDTNRIIKGFSKEEEKVGSN